MIELWRWFVGYVGASTYFLSSIARRFGSFGRVWHGIGRNGYGLSISEELRRI